MKEIQNPGKQNGQINEFNFCQKKLQKNPDTQNNSESIQENPPEIKIDKLAEGPLSKKSLPQDILNQLEHKLKKLVTEQHSIQSMFHTLFENIRNAVIVIDKNRQIIKINKNFCKISGYDESELKFNPNITSIFTKKDRKKIDQKLRHLENVEQSQNDDVFTVHCLCKDKSTRYVELNFAKIPGQKQTLIFMNDITEREKHEKEILRRNKELTVLNTISRSIKQPKDLQQILNLALEHTRSLMGMELGVIYLGNRSLKSLRPNVTIGINHENAIKLLEQNIALIKQIKKEKNDLFLNPSNGLIWEIFNKQPKCRSIALIPLCIRKNTFGILLLASKKQIEFDEEKKQLVSAIGHQLAINIENALLFKELEEKTKEVEAKNKELSSFVFTVSHDLKTPLIALHGYLDLFSEEFQHITDEAGREYLDRILYNAKYMDKMINDLLKLSRAGRVVGTKRRFSTYKLVHEIFMCLYPKIQQKQIKFYISKNLPMIYGDRHRIQTVFENLIGNAIKYSSEKRESYVEIDCRNQKNMYEFIIKDNGIGIDPSEHERIFDVFQKCAKKDESSYGTGVGLTIVKKIIEHHGGTVWVQSKLDKGAAFYFTLPKPMTQ